MTNHEAMSKGASANPPCEELYCERHYLLKLMLLALFVGVIGSGLYCAVGQPTSVDSSLDMSAVPASATAP